MNIKKYEKDHNEQNLIQYVESGIFKKIKKISEGSYGIVYLSEYKSDNSNLTYDFAIKAIKTDRTTDFIGSLKELDFLSKLSKYPMTLRLIAISKDSPFIIHNDSDGFYKDDSIFFIFEKASYDGTTFVLDNPGYPWIKLAMVQILLQLEYMHGHGILHRDIKTSNLLWFRKNEQRFMKICDFGISKMFTYQETNTLDAVTAIYRAPEIFLGYDRYGFKVDIWSAACVFYEFICKRPFINITNMKSTIKKYIEKIFMSVPEIPKLELIQKIKGLNINCISKRKGLAEQMGLSASQIKEFNMNSTYGTYSQFINLLGEMFKLDPDKRFNATQCLNHTFFEDMRLYINENRKLFKPFDLDIFNPIINIRYCDERFKAATLAINIYNNRYIIENNITKLRYNWYQHRILFHSLDLFDRFLEAHNSSLSDELIHLYYYSCLYMSIKYFLTLLSPDRFIDLLDLNPEFKSIYIDNPNLDKLIKDFEWYMLKNVVNYSVYRSTVFEAADFFQLILTEEQIRNLFSQYCRKCTDGPIHLFDYFNHIFPGYKATIPLDYIDVYFVSNNDNVISVSNNSTQNTEQNTETINNRYVNYISTIGPSKNSSIDVFPTGDIINRGNIGNMTLNPSTFDYNHLNLTNNLISLNLPNIHSINNKQ